MKQIAKGRENRPGKIDYCAYKKEDEGVISYKRTLRKIVILLGPHDRDFVFRVVVIADQVKQAVHDHPVQLVGELDAIEHGVLADGIHGDKQVAGEAVPLAVIEGDDVGIIIVLQIFYIDIQNKIIGAKYNRNITQALGLALGDELEPAAGEPLLLEGELRIFGKVRNHDGIFLQIYIFPQEE